MEHTKEGGFYDADGTRCSFAGRKRINLSDFMKNSRLDNPEVQTKDPRILKLAEVVGEVKQSEEWEAVRMSILSIGIERG